MPQTGVNDVLLSHGDETAMLKPTRKLYNLWHELPPEQRGSDVWKGEWGTLMHLILSHGLYDEKGIRYVADSFRAVALPGFNVSKDTGVPIRWSNDLGGYGMSDHLPVLATFALATEGTRPDVTKHDPSEPKTGRPVDYSKLLAEASPFSADSTRPENLGKVFQFKGRIVETKPLTLDTEHGRIRAWSFHDEVRKRLFGAKDNEPLIGHGRLTRYRGNWQLIVEKPDWLE